MDEKFVNLKRYRIGNVSGIWLQTTFYWSSKFQDYKPRYDKFDKIRIVSKTFVYDHDKQT